MKVRYALQALSILAQRAPEPASIAAIAVGSRAPRKFLEAILLELKMDGLLKSRMGRMGGYELARAAGLISIADVIRCLDGPLAMAPCAARNATRACPGCIDITRCAIRPSLMDAREAVANVLEHRSIADLARVSAAREEFS